MCNSILMIPNHSLIINITYMYYFQRDFVFEFIKRNFLVSIKSVKKRYSIETNYTRAPLKQILIRKIMHII